MYFFFFVTIFHITLENFPHDQTNILTEEPQFFVQKRFIQNSNKILKNTNIFRKVTDLFHTKKKKFDLFIS